MIVSDRYRYVFVQLPRTGSTAIANELRQQYHGYPVLYKHATYEEFLTTASAEQKDYFVFSCVRNPLDDVVSVYAKYAHDPRNRFKGQENIKRQSRTSLERWRDRRRMHFIERNKGGFEEFFLRFYRLPYSRWTELSHSRFNFIIRFERLEQDFREAMLLLGIEPIRPLPASNRTGGKDCDYVSYYTPKSIPRAKRVFGPYMKKWGYEFPVEWGELEVPLWNQIGFELVGAAMWTYWGFLRPRLVKLRTSALPQPPAG